MTTDPYAALGVARDASQDDIRKAYRRKAQRAHPDRKGGDAERFRAIQEAYDILSDPARRSRYDETGDTGQAPDRDANALNYAASVLRVVIDSAQDVDSADLLTDMSTKIKADIEAQLKTRENMLAAYSKRSKVMERLSYPGGDGPLRSMVQTDLTALDAAVKRVDANVETMRRALEIVGEHSYTRTTQADPMDELIRLLTAGAA